LDSVVLAATTVKTLNGPRDKNCIDFYNIISNILKPEYNSYECETWQPEVQIFVLPAGLGSFYLPASQRQIKNNHSLRPLRLCGEKILL
jgi:hypothetical protein